MEHAGLKHHKIKTVNLQNGNYRGYLKSGYWKAKNNFQTLFTAAKPILFCGVSHVSSQKVNYKINHQSFNLPWHFSPLGYRFVVVASTVSKPQGDGVRAELVRRVHLTEVAGLTGGVGWCLRGANSFVFLLPLIHSLPFSFSSLSQLLGNKHHTLVISNFVRCMFTAQ